MTLRPLNSLQRRPTRAPSRQGWLTLVSASVLALGLVACGGGSSDPAPVVNAHAYTKLVVFGDSLSDVGTYATAGVVAMGGGKFTVNGATNKIWVENLAGRIGVAAPCAARTGLESAAGTSLAGLAGAITDHAGCYGYAQGGARVTNPIGPSNKALLALGDPSGALGLLTQPVVDQVVHHLSVSTSFGSGDLVAVLAGANDAFMQAATVSAAVAGGAAAQTATTTAAAAMSTAATDLANLVRTQIIAKGATRVVVMNLPDVSATPDLVAQGAQAQALMTALVSTFNLQLQTELGQNANVMLVDLYTRSQDQAARPTSYGLTDVVTMACPAATNPIKSLGCSAATTLTGVDISHYLYADGVHPTPYGHQLIADKVMADLTAKGWQN